MQFGDSIVFDDPMGFGGFDAAFTIMPVLIIGGIFAFIIYAIVSGAKRQNEISSSPVEFVKAKVASKRIHVSGNEHSFTHYYVTFEKENGQRVEMSVQGESYGMLAEGDVGTLRHKGPRFDGFDRDI